MKKFAKIIPLVLATITSACTLEGPPSNLITSPTTISSDLSSSDVTSNSDSNFSPDSINNTVTVTSDYTNTTYSNDTVTATTPVVTTPSSTPVVTNNDSLPPPPEKYYESLNFNLTGTALRTALGNIIKNEKSRPFSYDTIDMYMAHANEDPLNPNNTILFYSGRSVPKDYYNPGNGRADAWNKEHVWPKSIGFSSQGALPHYDLHHLMPSEHGLNNVRSSKAFDNGGSDINSYKAYNETIIVDYADPTDKVRSTSTTFEPRNVEKGDIARIMFFMETRYKESYNLTLVNSTAASGTSIGKLSTLLQWHQLDPVDEWEMARNNYIYSQQGNRNPFIDYPELVGKIWG